MVITVFCWLGVSVGLVHRIRCNFYELANWTIRNGVLLGQTTELLLIGAYVTFHCGWFHVFICYHSIKID